MDRPDVMNALQEIIRDVLDDETFDVTPETSAKDHEEWDSFNNVNIIVAIEMKFGIKFQTAEIESAASVGDLADIVARKSQAA